MAVSLSVDLVQGNLCTNQLTVMCTTRGNEDQSVSGAIRHV